MGTFRVWAGQFWARVRVRSRVMDIFRVWVRVQASARVLDVFRICVSQFWD